MTAKPARKRYRVVITHYHGEGWEWEILRGGRPVAIGRDSHTSKRAAQGAGCRLLAAIKAGDMDEGELK